MMFHEVAHWYKENEEKTPDLVAQLKRRAKRHLVLRASAHITDGRQYRIQAIGEEDTDCSIAMGEGVVCWRAYLIVEEM
jgi:hypothetical protein